MPNFSHAAGTVIAADTRNAFSAYDAALLGTSKLVSSMLEGNQGSGLAPARSQKVLDLMASSFEQAVAGRKAMVQAHIHLQGIQGISNLQETDFGCLEDGLARGSVKAMPEHA